MALRLHSPLPPFPEAEGWINGGPVTNAQLAGAPVLVHFWAVGCHVCEHQLPTVAQWARRFGPLGLKLVGVHVPVEGTPDDLTHEGIAREAERIGLTHPIAIDSAGRIADAFEVRSTPSYFVFDATGKLRHFHAGPFAEEFVEHALDRVTGEWLAEAKAH